MFERLAVILLKQIEKTFFAEQFIGQTARFRYAIRVYEEPVAGLERHLMLFEFGPLVDADGIAADVNRAGALTSRKKHRMRMTGADKPELAFGDVVEPVEHREELSGAFYVI